MRKWWIVPAIMIVTVTIGLIGGAWSQRPIIEYTFEGFTDTFDSQYGSMEVWLKIKNTGAIYARLNLVLVVENANISLNKIEQGMECNGTHLRINCDLPSGMEAYDECLVSIQPKNHFANFTLDLEIENLADWSIPNGFIGQFLEPHAYSTHLVYNRTDSTTYKLIS